MTIGLRRPEGPFLSAQGAADVVGEALGAGTYSILGPEGAVRCDLLANRECPLQGQQVRGILTQGCVNCVDSALG